MTGYPRTYAPSLGRANPHEQDAPPPAEPSYIPSPVPVLAGLYRALDYYDARRCDERNAAWQRADEKARRIAARIASLSPRSHAPARRAAA